jgi:predicted TIM-barrel fold metal-dependent hydrolase
MLTVDADAHVIENESAWDYMLESERAFKPKIVGATDADPSIDYWFIDGRLMPRSNVETKLPEAARDMSDLSIRIKHMDELNVDIQVIYPTIFIFPTARRAEVDLALCRSYNRWMAGIVAQAADRFRWVVVPPLLNMDRVTCLRCREQARHARVRAFGQWQHCLARFFSRRAGLLQIQIGRGRGVSFACERGHSGPFPKVAHWHYRSERAMDSLRHS